MAKKESEQKAFGLSIISHASCSAFASVGPLSCSSLNQDWMDFP